MSVEVVEVGAPAGVGTVTVGGLPAGSVAVGTPMGAAKLDDLTDVDATATGLAGQTLVKAGDGQWRPAAPPAASIYTHIQATPQAVVTIAHNLGRRPPVISLFSLDYAQNYDAFQVSHIDTASLRISVDNPTAYVALIQ